MTEQEWRKKFSKRIIDAMQYMDITQKELSISTNIPESTLSDYIAARRTPKASVVVNIAKALRYDTDELIDFGETISK